MKHVKTTLNVISFCVAGVKTKQMSLNRLYFTGERKMHRVFHQKSVIVLLFCLAVVTPLCYYQPFDSPLSFASVIPLLQSSAIFVIPYGKENFSG